MPFVAEQSSAASPRHNLKHDRSRYLDRSQHEQLAKIQSDVRIE